MLRKAGILAIDMAPSGELANRVNRLRMAGTGAAGHANS